MDELIISTIMQVIRQDAKAVGISNANLAEALKKLLVELEEKPPEEEIDFAGLLPMEDAERLERLQKLSSVAQRKLFFKFFPSGDPSAMPEFVMIRFINSAFNFLKNKT